MNKIKNETKKPYQKAIAFMVVIVLVMQFSLITSAGAESQDVRISLQAGEYKISQDREGFEIIQMDGFTNLEIQGKPSLPIKSFTYSLPPGAVAVSLDVISQTKIEVSGQHKIIFGQPGLTGLENQKAPKVEMDKNTYGSDNPFPEENVKISNQGKMRKWSLVTISFSPFIYSPKSEKLVLIKEVSLKINYRIEEKLSAKELADSVMDTQVQEKVLNFTQAASWYKEEATAPGPSLVYDYVIITPDSLSSSVSNLKTYKESRGYKVNLVTTSWISSNYSGANSIEKIRNFLKANYLNWGIKYVLLVGSVSSIPMLECWPEAGNFTPQEDIVPIPTDFYYADLTGDWDSNGNGYPGEYGQDNVDFNPEVYVGRIPVDDSQAVSSICEKMISFDSDSGAWKNNALLLGAISNYENEDMQMAYGTDGAVLMELIKSDILGPKGFSSTTEYEKEGLSPSTYSCSLPLTHANVISQLSGQDYGIVNWHAHGSHTGAFKKVWANDSNWNNIPEASEMSWGEFISASDTSQLTRKQPIVFSASCLNAYPESTNLAAELLKQGASATVAGTRATYYWLGWDNKDTGGNASVDYYFFYYLVGQNQPVGEALGQTINYYRNNLYVSGEYNWQHQTNLFAFNLYGDSSLKTTGSAPTITSPTGSIVINGGAATTNDRNVTLTLNATSNAGTPAGLSGMIIGDDASFSGRSWESYNTTKSWTLPTPDGNKTVYVKFKGNNGETSPVYSDSIQLTTTTTDKTPPTGSIIINNGNTVCQQTQVTLTLSATDTGSGVASMAISNDNFASGTNWENYTTSKTWNLTSGNGLKTVYVKYKDAAGNISKIYSASITLITAKNVKRLWGDNRYLTAIKISQEGWPNGANMVVLARGDLFPDALAGAPLAAKYNAPILLTSPYDLNAETAQEIIRLGANSVIILGTEDAVSSYVEMQLFYQCGIFNIYRIGGADRYETAGMIATHLDHPANKTAFICYGENYPDALSAASVSYYNKMPILLVRSNYIPSWTIYALRQLGIQNLIITGQSDVVPEWITSWFKANGWAVGRLGGDTRYDTCALIANYSMKNLGMSANTLGIASGENFPDALSLGTLAGKNKAPLLLVRQTFVPEAIASCLASNKNSINNIYIAGGTDVVSKNVEDQILNLIK